MPVWSTNGHELYYASLNGELMAATVHAGKTFLADNPRVLFSSRLRLVSAGTRRQYDVTSDGRFLVNTVPPEPQGMPGITLVQNWTATLKK